MARINSSLNILIFFFSLFIFTTIEGHIPCNTDKDCPRYFCPPPLTPTCIKFFCKCNRSLPLVHVGGFNVVIGSHDKFGRFPPNKTSTNEFLSCTNQNQFMHLYTND
ncbi:hypothetical protein KIW84_013578, partial [Lathyrus oleraceus]